MVGLVIIWGRSNKDFGLKFKNNHNVKYIMVFILLTVNNKLLYSFDDQIKNDKRFLI